MTKEKKVVVSEKTTEKVKAEGRKGIDHKKVLAFEPKKGTISVGSQGRDGVAGDR